MSVTPKRETGIPAPKRLTDARLSMSDLSTSSQSAEADVKSTGSSILSSDQTTVVYVGEQSLPPPPLPPVSNDSGRSSDGESIYEYSLPSIAFTPRDNRYPMQWPIGFPRLPSLQQIDFETTIFPESSCHYSSSNATPITNQKLNSMKAKKSQVVTSKWSIKSVVIICLLAATIICQVSINALLVWDNNTLRDKLDREIGKTSNCELRCYEKIHKQQSELEKACADRISRENKKLSEIIFG